VFGGGAPALQFVVDSASNHAHIENQEQIFE